MSSSNVDGVSLCSFFQSRAVLFYCSQILGWEVSTCLSTSPTPHFSQILWRCVTTSRPWARPRAWRPSRRWMPATLTTSRSGRRSLSVSRSYKPRAFPQSTPTSSASSSESKKKKKNQSVFVIFSVNFFTFNKEN